MYYILLSVDVCLVPVRREKCQGKSDCMRMCGWIVATQSIEYRWTFHNVSLYTQMNRYTDCGKNLPKTKRIQNWRTQYYGTNCKWYKSIRGYRATLINAEVESSGRRCNFFFGGWGGGGDGSGVVGAKTCRRAKRKRKAKLAMLGAFISYHRICIGVL